MSQSIKIIPLDYNLIIFGMAPSQARYAPLSRRAKEPVVMMAITKSTTKVIVHPARQSVKSDALE